MNLPPRAAAFGRFIAFAALFYGLITLFDRLLRFLKPGGMMGGMCH